MSTAQNPVIAEPGNSSATIRARVGASAIDKVTRLFSAGLADIFTETLLDEPRRLIRWWRRRLHDETRRYRRLTAPVAALGGAPLRGCGLDGGSNG